MSQLPVAVGSPILNRKRGIHLSCPEPPATDGPSEATASASRCRRFAAVRRSTSTTPASCRSTISTPSRLRWSMRRCAADSPSAVPHHPAAAPDSTAQLSGEPHLSAVAAGSRPPVWRRFAPRGAKVTHRQQCGRAFRPAGPTFPSEVAASRRRPVKNGWIVYDLINGTSSTAGS